MRWSDERYVRLYIRDTVEWDMLPWESRALWPLLLRKVDRAGLLDLGKHGARGLAVTVKLPTHVVEPGLAGLLEDGCVVQNGTTLLVRNFIEAQEAQSSTAHRSREYRARQRDAARRGVMEGDASATEDDASITERDATATPRTSASQPVTPSLAVPSRAVKEPTAEAVGAPEAEPDELDEPPMPEGLENPPAPLADDPPPASKSAHAITRLAEQGGLTGELLAAAMRQKKLGKNRRPLYDAAVTGTALRLRSQYVARRSMAERRPRSEAEAACDRNPVQVKRAAENVLQLGCTVERYLDVAFDTKPAKLAFPPLAHLMGPLMLEKVPAWLPPDQRKVKDFDPAEHTPIQISAEERAAFADDPNPAWNEIPGEDLAVTWAKQEAYDRGKAEGLSNDELRKLIAAAAAEALAAVDEESAA
jgi:hypothetical protein